MTYTLITGATGSLGEHLVKILSLYDKEFCISLRSTSCNNPLESRKIETFRNQGLIKFIEMDYNNLESISHNKLEGIEKIFLLTPYLSILDVTKKIVTEAQKTKSVKHIIKLSDMGTNLAPPPSGGMRHRQAER
ncbi:NmrA family NAD(P)-binding protein [Candidatus Nitrosocosmicus hydrocola]|uniref:NmrA family NAD(P)-binding protein n=1 Tax=Candidatus Nitrosocosmicus hydrocola TaxID=1826872 RepID=UPI0011E59F91|nr:NmrA family NAD(P)-binding protein [Candidatus Nitrosocosmicus hydrocola]